MSDHPILKAETNPSAMEFGLSRFKLFLALSRTPHGLLDLAAPALAALLALGTFPPPGVIALGLLTVFAGYTAVYALNDVVDCRVDQEKFLMQGAPKADHYLDDVFVRHPMAAGWMSFREGLLWTGGWAFVALLGAYTLNPVCALIFLLGCILEAVYCLLLKVSHLRLLVAGVVKSLGAAAAVFAVDSQPSPVFLAVLFLWIFLWEVGGQNIPADWHDVEPDRRLKAKTIPVVFGLRKAGALSLAALAGSLILSLAILRLGPVTFPLSHHLLILGLGVYLLLLPAWRLYRNHDCAAALFNRASYYPLAVLAVVLANLWASPGLAAWW
ncbi:MAG: UbiA family prenyltransferase [Deltaproteobacteria bacterium]|nr:UbiA family prenyltransferase [Deltaproteobacteria bacterium]